MNATTKLRIATYLRRLADRLNPPVPTITLGYTGQFNGVTVYGSTTGPAGFSVGPLWA